MAWQASGVIAPPAALERAAEVDRMLVVSGSCSPVTAAQIACGLADGYVGIRADVPALMRGESDEEARLIDATRAALDSSGRCVVHPAAGPPGEPPPDAAGRQGGALGQTDRASVWASK